MLIIYDEINKKVINNMGTNSLFPDGNFPELDELPEGQIYLKCHDNSEIGQKIMSAYDYEIVSYTEDGVITEVKINKTLEEYYAEQPEEISEEEQRLRDIENILADILGGGLIA